MAYTDIDKPSDYFNTALWTGNGSTTNITSLDFQPDFTWIKGRSDAIAHVLFDSVRGAGGNKELGSNVTYAEGGNSSISYGFLSSFNSDGFTVRNGTSSPNQADYTNKNSSTYAAWNWKAGGSASSNSNGSITSSVSANQDAGFSIVSYTANGNAGTTIGHGLGAVPSMIITKDRDASGLWLVYHAKSDSSAPQNKYLELNTTGTVQDYPVWNDTAPTSSVFTIGTAAENNTNGRKIIAYCFAEKQGYSKFGSYVGNGNTSGTFCYTGMKPAFVLLKNTTAVDQWMIFDNKREGYNPDNDFLRPNLSNAEGTESGAKIDLLSNGFKLRGSGGGIGQTNTSGQTYIYMCFASNPFTTSTGVPATAR